MFEYTASRLAPFAGYTFGGWLATWGLIDFLIAAVIIAACIAIVYVALRQFGFTIPDWAVKIFWIVVVCFVAIVAIRLIVSM